MNEMDIAEKAVREKRQVLAVIVSKWHLIGALSYIHGLHEKNGGALIAVLPHPTNGYLVDAAILPELCTEIVHCSPTGLLFEWVVLLKGWLRYCAKAFLKLKYHKPAYKMHFVCVMHPQTRNLLPLLAQKGAPDLIECTVIDEGVGTYMPASHWEMINKSEFQTQTKARRVLARLSKSIALLPFGNPADIFLFEKVGEKLRLRRDVVNLYRCFFNDVYWSINYYSSEKYLVEEELPDRPLCLYVSQPVVEDGLVKENVYRDILHSLRFFCDDRGWVFIVKPHPRESLERYKNMDVRVLYSNHVAEALVNDLKPIAIVGLTSTSLVTISCIYNIPSFSLLGVFEENNPENATRFAHLAVLKKLFIDYVSYVNNIKDIVIR